MVLSLTRSVLLHDAASCSREDSLCERVGPCDTLSCFFFSALCLQRRVEYTFSAVSRFDGFCLWLQRSPIHIVAGGSVSERYLVDLFQDVPD